MWRQESTQINAPTCLRPQTPRVSALRFPAALETRGLPSVASPFAGASDHRTLAFSRLTPRPSVYLRGSAEGPLFAPAFLLRSKDRCAASVVRPLAGAGIHWIPAFLRLAPVPGPDAGLAALRCPCSCLQARGSPSVASPFSGSNVHWTFVLIRFTLAPPLTGPLFVCTRGSA